MKQLNRWLLPALAIVVFFGVVGVGQATGWWVTSGRTLPAGAVSGPGASGGSGGTGSGTGAERVTSPGSLAPADLKGWMTLQQAADGLGIPVADLVAAIGPPAGVTLDPQTAFKDVEKLVPGFSLADLRTRLTG